MNHSPSRSHCSWNLCLIIMITERRILIHQNETSFRRISSDWSPFLCSKCNIAPIISSVKRWVLIFCELFVNAISQAHLRERAIFQACLIKRDFSWKCIGRQPDSEGSLSRAVHGVCHYFTGIFHLLSHSIFLVWPHFYDKFLEKYIRLIFLPRRIWYKSHLIFVAKSSTESIFLQKTHYLPSVLFT